MFLHARAGASFLPAPYDGAGDRLKMQNVKFKMQNKNHYDSFGARTIIAVSP